MNDDLRSRLHALGDSPDLNRPVADLDAVVRRARTRRQRSGRMLAGGVTVALVVAGTAAAIPRLSHDPRPAVDRDTPDLPAACLLTPEQMAAQDGGAPRDWKITATPSDFGTRSPRTSGLEVALDVGFPLFADRSADLPELSGWIYGVTTAVARDGRVVAVLGGDPAPTISEAQSMAVDVIPQPVPLRTDVEAPLISCETGERTVLGSGTYQLLVTVTAALVRSADSSGGTEITMERTVVRTTSEPLDVEVTAGSDAAGPLACGATDGRLHALADPQQNPAPVRVTVDAAASSVASGGDIHFTTTAHNDTGDHLTGWADQPHAVLTRDGAIVGGLEPSEAVALELDLDAGSSESFPTWTGLRACTPDGGNGAGLPPGSYELWTVMGFTVGTPGAAAVRDWQAAGGPWALEITASPDGPDEPVPPAACGLVTEELAADDFGIPSRTEPSATEPTGDDQWLSAESEVVATSVRPALDGPWRLTTQIDVDPGPGNELLGPPDGWTYGSTVVLMQDDVVVAVLGTGTAPPRADARDMDVDAPRRTFPLATEVEAAPISCATGERAVLEPGLYQLVSSTTAGVVVDDDDIRVIRATSVPVEVRVTADSIAAGPLGCGATDDELRALADPPVNPSPLRLAAAPATVIGEGTPLTFPVTATNNAPGPQDVEASMPVVVVTRGGTIVGGLDAVDDRTVVIAGDATRELEASTALRSCGLATQPAPLPPGTYELWVLVPVVTSLADFARPGDQGSWLTTAGPFPLQITTP